MLFHKMDPKALTVCASTVNKSFLELYLLAKLSSVIYADRDAGNIKNSQNLTTGHSPMLDPSVVYVMQRSFTDFDECATDVRQWNLDLRQLDCGAFSGNVLQFGVGNAHISEARFGRMLIQSGLPPAGLRTIAIPAVRDTRFVWRNQKITGEDILVFPPNAELDAVSTPEFHVFTCSFPADTLEQAAEDLQLGSLTEVLGPTEVFRCARTRVAAVRRCLQRACQAVRGGSHIPGETELSIVISFELPRLLLMAIANSSTVRRRPPGRKRDHALSRARDYIDQFADESIQVGDLCRVAEVSQRTLEYAFLERYGVTPKSFLVALRLNNVRRDLRRADPGQRIADIANRWGFWHMGQFAADYRKQFGELPSQTLERVLARCCAHN